MWLIAAQANEQAWEANFSHNPMENGLPICFSAYQDPIAKTVPIFQTYFKLELANEDLEELVKLNPAGNYAVCPVGQFAYQMVRQDPVEDEKVLETEAEPQE